MTEFKKGDTVEVVNVGEDFSITIGERHVLTRDPDRGGWLYIDSADQFYRPDRFKHVQPEGPVRTVTRCEIVPGVYGVVRIKNGRNGNAVDVWMEGSPSTGFAHWYTADELDAAARTLQQLAEALRDDMD